MPQKKTITITDSDINTGKLALPDGGVTKVSPGTEITWFLANNCGVASITAILPKNPSRSTIWSKEPGKFGSSTMWTGTVDSKVRLQDDVWEYKIKWIDDTDNNPHIYDPKIIVNPKI